MKNVAELKRIKIGTKLKLIKRGENLIKNEEQERIVVEIKSNSICFEIPSKNNRRSWLQFPTAKEFKETDNGFIITSHGFSLHYVL